MSYQSWFCCSGWCQWSLSAVVCFIVTSLLGSDQTVSSMRTFPVHHPISVWMMTPTSWGRSRSRRADCRGEFTGPTGPLWAECWLLPSWCLCSSCKVWIGRFNVVNHIQDILSCLHQRFVSKDGVDPSNQQSNTNKMLQEAIVQPRAASDCRFVSSLHCISSSEADKFTLFLPFQPPGTSLTGGSLTGSQSWKTTVPPERTVRPQLPSARLTCCSSHLEGWCKLTHHYNVYLDEKFRFLWSQVAKPKEWDAIQVNKLNLHFRSFPSSSVQTFPSNTSSDVQFYLNVYTCIAVANTVFTALRAFLFAYGVVCASTFIHRRLLDRVLKVRHLSFVHLKQLSLSAGRRREPSRADWVFVMFGSSRWGSEHQAADWMAARMKLYARWWEDVNYPQTPLNVALTLLNTRWIFWCFGKCSSE